MLGFLAFCIQQTESWKLDYWSERRTDKLMKCCIILKTFLIPIIVKFDLLFFIAMLGVTTLNFAFHQKHGLVTLENLEKPHKQVWNFVSTPYELWSFVK